MHCIYCQNNSGNYAHGKHELKLKYNTLSLMESSGQIANAVTYLARPCMTWVSTGACPFGRRCAAIHDPSVSGPLECPSWLPVATSKTNAHIIVDKLAAHRDNVVHQENPLVAQSIWENCRPSLQPSSFGSSDIAMKDIDQEWHDTYALVCNTDVSAFPKCTSASSEELSDLQKLCIVHAMRSGDSAPSQVHRDYVFNPTHSMHSELCMILQARCFLLKDVGYANATRMTPEDVIKEITIQEFKLTTEHSNPSRCVMVHEVAFAPKGDHSANVSIWFNADPTKLDQSQIKRSRRLKQRKKTQIRNEHSRPNAGGTLISRTSAVDFPNGYPDIDPFVPMLPTNDDDESHRLLLSIIEHRIDSIIFGSCSSGDGEQKKHLNARMAALEKALIAMTSFHKKWTWPKREGMGRVSMATMAPPGNIMPYIPLKTNETSSCIHIWHSFVKTMGMLDNDIQHSSLGDTSERLSVFLSFDGSITRTKLNPKVILPHIHSPSSELWGIKTHSHKKDTTWKEVLLGLSANGEWKEALRLHNKKISDLADSSIRGRNMPLSAVPFVQA
mmetsp:Transcript_45930/g.96449  ORF Transcript_45930/g.96449 Transcript_45930/m.96449 type:complete len:557 (+) Transcript_45930:62-1732(+)